MASCMVSSYGSQAAQANEEPPPESSNLNIGVMAYLVFREQLTMTPSLLVNLLKHMQMIMIILK